METVGTNALSSLNVINFQIDPKNQRGTHCPVPNGFGYISVVGYTDSSFSTDTAGVNSFLRTQANKTRIPSGVTGYSKLIKQGVAVIPGGHVPVQLKVDTNQTILNGPPLTPPEFDIAYQAGYVSANDPLPNQTLITGLDLSYSNAGSVFSCGAVSGSPGSGTGRLAFAEDYALIVKVNTGIVSSGQLRVTILCVPVSGGN